MIEHNDPHVAAQSDPVTYERDPDEPPSRSVIRAVAAVNGTDPTRLPPLYGAVDPDALDRLFDPAPGHPEPRPDCVVSFRYDDFAVTVSGDGRIVVSPAD